MTSPTSAQPAGSWQRSPPRSGMDGVSDAEARAAGLKVLRFLDQNKLWCNSPSGCVGNQLGLVYRFTGIDPSGVNGPLTGTRKIDVNGRNNVEASTIDTAILQMGAAAFASGFPNNTEIKGLVGRLLARTRWDQILNPPTGRLRLAWKPEIDSTPDDDDTTHDYFDMVPAVGGGYWASTDPPLVVPDQVLDIDYWTDE